MTELREVASLIRSKNAGPFHITFDVFVEDPGVYRRMKENGALDPGTIAEIYGVDRDAVTFVEYDEASAFKATIPRQHSSGSVEDRDLMGGQQHAPLVDLEVDLER